MKMISRILVLAGAAAVVVSAGLPWVTVKGALPSTLDLGLIGAEVSPLGPAATTAIESRVASASIRLTCAATPWSSCA